LYYQEANHTWPGICPSFYHYRLDPDLIFTLESYIPGSPLPLKNLSIREATKIGESLGNLIQQMQQKPAPLPGHGLVTWKGGGWLLLRDSPGQPCVKNDENRHASNWQHCPIRLSTMTAVISGENWTRS
jgi:hypothetical protein